MDWRVTPTDFPILAGNSRNGETLPVYSKFLSYLNYQTCAAL